MRGAGDDPYDVPGRQQKRNGNRRLERGGGDPLAEARIAGERAANSTTTSSQISAATSRLVGTPLILMPGAAARTSPCRSCATECRRAVLPAGF